MLGRLPPGGVEVGEPLRSLADLGEASHLLLEVVAGPQGLEGGILEGPAVILEPGIDGP